MLVLRDGQDVHDGGILYISRFYIMQYQAEVPSGCENNK